MKYIASDVTKQYYIFSRSYLSSLSLLEKVLGLLHYGFSCNDPTTLDTEYVKLGTYMAVSFKR